MDTEAADDADLQVAPHSPADLRAELERADLARHLAFFYQSQEEQLQTVASYLKYGLQANHRCLYLVDVNTADRLKAALRGANVDVAERIEASDLVIRDAEEVYLESGFDPERMITALEESATESVTVGYDGLWMAGENSWCFQTEFDFDHILDFEVEFDETCPDLPVTALCQYDLTQFGERSAAKALWTHEQIIYRNKICENPFYIPPEQYRSATEPDLNIRLMLEQTYNLSQAKQQVAQREQRLDVLNRVFRHNIRNDLNVVDGILRLLADQGTVSAEHSDDLTAAIQHIEGVVAMAEKARYVQQTIGDSTIERRELDSAIGDAVDRVSREYPEAEITVTGETSVSVYADTNLDAALAEAITNAIVLQDTEPPEVTVSVSVPAPERVRVDIVDPGPPIPKVERESLQQGRETPLEHANGLGLWLVKWIVENAYGSMEFPETDGERGRLRLELRRATVS